MQRQYSRRKLMNTFMTLSHAVNGNFKNWWQYLPSSMLINLCNQSVTHQPALVPHNDTGNAKKYYSLECILFGMFVLFLSWESATAILFSAYSLFIFHLSFLVTVPAWCRHQLISPVCLLAWALCSISPSR